MQMLKLDISTVLPRNAYFFTVKKICFAQVISGTRLVDIFVL